MNSLPRIRFFQNQVHMDGWKNSMSGKNEQMVIAVFEELGYELNKDYVRQYPIGEKFVMDFAFVPERISVEVDGETHNSKKQKALDKKRDNYLYENGWVSIRIKESEFTGYKASFYKSLIKEVVSERRKQRDEGFLYHIDIPNYVEEDYE